MNYNVLAYAVYAPVAIGLTIWVARMLHKNTRYFLSEIFKEHEDVATATNNLLQVGFYLISLGFAFVRLRIRGEGHWNGNDWVYEDLHSYRQMIEELSSKIGGFTLLIGFMLFLNLFLMLLLRRSKKQRNLPLNIPTYSQQLPKQ